MRLVLFLAILSMAMASYYVLRYTYSGDFVQKRAPYQPAHRDLIDVWYNKSVIVAVGVTGRPSQPYGGMLIFNASSGETVKKIFVDHDPYVAHGIATSWQILQWTVELGSIDGTYFPGLTYPATYYLLEYAWARDFLTKREPYRAVHKDLFLALLAQYKLVAAGVTGRPTSPYGGMLIFNVSSAEAVKAMAVDRDPYVAHKLVAKSVAHFAVDHHHRLDPRHASPDSPVRSSPHWEIKHLCRTLRVIDVHFEVSSLMSAYITAFITRASLFHYNFTTLPVVAGAASAGAVSRRRRGFGRACSSGRTRRPCKKSAPRGPRPRT